MEIAREREDKENETNAYIQLGYSYQNKNQVQTAIEYFEKALEIAREREDKKNETNAYIGLKEAYGKNKQTQKAIGHCKKALEIGKERRNTNIQKIAQNLSTELSSMEGKLEETVINNSEIY